MFPAMVMAMAAGAVFGMLWGTLLVWLGSTIGQTLAFVVGRCAVIGWVAAELVGRGSTTLRACAGGELVTLAGNAIIGCC
jgi:uncharacterized membrane protein YdjX (TVP38/TMEM64 family)